MEGETGGTRRELGKDRKEDTKTRRKDNDKTQNIQTYQLSTVHNKSNEEGQITVRSSSY